MCEPRCRARAKPSASSTADRARLEDGRFGHKLRGDRDALGADKLGLQLGLAVLKEHLDHLTEIALQLGKSPFVDPSAMRVFGLGFQGFRAGVRREGRSPDQSAPARREHRRGQTLPSDKVFYDHLRNDAHSDVWQREVRFP